MLQHIPSHVRGQIRWLGAERLRLGCCIKSCSFRSFDHHAWLQRFGRCLDCRRCFRVGLTLNVVVQLKVLTSQSGVRRTTFKLTSSAQWRGGRKTRPGDPSRKRPSLSRLGARAGSLGWGVTPLSVSLASPEWSPRHPSGHR